MNTNMNTNICTTDKALYFFNVKDIFHLVDSSKFYKPQNFYFLVYNSVTDIIIKV